MGTIKLSLRTDKLIKKSGRYPIELLYQVHGERKYVSTGQKVPKENWSGDEQKAIFIDKKLARSLFREVSYEFFLKQSEVTEVNYELSSLCKKIRNIEKSYELKYKEGRVSEIIDELKSTLNPGKLKRDLNNIFEFIDQYIAEHSTTRVKGSLSVYKSLRTHLHNFGEAISFDKIDYQFFVRFQDFLVNKTIKRGEKVIKAPLTNITAAKQLSTLKTFLNYAKLRGVEVSEKYKAFKIKQEKLEVIALTEDEFLKLYHLDLTDNKALRQVRDVFCFSCVTGLRYSDLQQLKRENVKEDEIKITVKKTKDPLTIPLSGYGKEILKKYEDHHRPLPVISNQKMNDHLKNLGKKAGIDEEIEIVRYKGNFREAVVYPKYDLIGCHTGRKSFCTISLDKGMSAEEVMAISGHTDYKSFKRYIKITEQRKKLSLLKAWGPNVNLRIA